MPIPGTQIAIDTVFQVMKNTFAMVGDLRLDLSTSPKAWTEKRGHEWAEHSQLGDRPKLQSVGNKLDELKLDFQLHSGAADIGKVFNALVDYKETATVLPITMGDGEFLGNFVITEMEFQRSSTFAMGTTLAAAFSVTFREYVQPAVLVTMKRAKAVSKGAKTKKTTTWDQHKTTGHIEAKP